MSEVEAARARLEALLKGRYVPRESDVESAKRRLQACDPGIDISEALEALSRGDLPRAADALLYQAVAPQTIAFMAPVIASFLQAMMGPAPREESPKEEG